MKISWVILTYNRSSHVLKAIPHCMLNAGYPWEEIIWVDNGSAKGEYYEFDRFFGQHEKVTRVSIPKNLGVAKGYNTGMALARGTHIVITGCDMLMPAGWLHNMVRSFDLIPRQAIATIYASPMSVVPERVRGNQEQFGDLRVQQAMPIGRRLMPTDLQRKIGYFHEGFGLYGWDDVAWGHRAEVVLKQLGLKSYCLIDHIAEHLGTEGTVGFDHKDEHEYWKWKRQEVEDPKKQDLMNKLKSQGWPGFNPYA